MATAEAVQCDTMNSRLVTPVCFSSDGRYAFAGCDDKMLRVWNARTGNEICRILHSIQPKIVCMSPDGARLASVYYYNRVNEDFTFVSNKIVHRCH
jgi:WD40 repeat protein